MLNERYQRQLILLLSELVTCWQRRQRDELRVAAAFLVSQKHCQDLKAEILCHGFACDESEIHFFKHLLPQFSGRLIYYTIVYEALLSCPKIAEEVAPYWQKETERYDRFCEKNAELVRYHMSESTEADAFYYLRRNKDQIIMHPQREFFSCCDDYTIWSGPTSYWFAEKSYRQFVDSKR
jgi:hypothetical protein